MSKAPILTPQEQDFPRWYQDVINKAELASYVAITGAAISGVTFNAGTFLNVWGRNTD